MTQAAKTLFLLQLGQRSTDYYYHRLQAIHPVKCIPANFDYINQHLPNNFPILKTELEGLLDQCQKADAIVIPNITLHQTLDEYCDTRYRKLPIVHPLTAGLNALLHQGINKACIIGSRYTMQGNYLSNHLQARGIECTKPDEKQIAEIDRYRQAVYKSKETVEQHHAVMRIIEQFAEQATVMLACTELSIKFGQINALDLARQQIKAAIKTLGKL